MGAIGDYPFPDHDVVECYKMVRPVFTQGIREQADLASVLGHTNPSSGAYRSKLTSLKRYGLITGGSEIELTELGHTISSAENVEDISEDLGRAVLRIQLFKRLLVETDWNEPGPNFYYKIVKATGVAPSEAREVSSKISNILEVNTQYARIWRNQIVHEVDPSEEDKQLFNEMNDTLPQESSYEDVTESHENPVLITSDAEIRINSRGTYRAAKALLEEIGEEYE